MMAVPFVLSDPSSLIGIIDIGSNSVRLVVFDTATRAPVALLNEKATCGLGRGLNETGRLEPKRMKAALENLARFKEVMDTFGLTRRYVVATAATRIAKNGAAFVKKVEAVLGHPIHVISGVEEGRLSATGLLSVLPDAEGVMGDLGGGSLEFAEINVKPDADSSVTGVALQANQMVLNSATQIGRCESLFVGHQRLVDILDDASGDLNAVAAVVREKLDEVPWIDSMRDRAFYSVGGAWRRLAGVHMQLNNYPLHVPHRYALPLDEAMMFFKSAQNPEQHANILSPKVRYEETRLWKVFSVSSVIMEEILKRGRPREVVFSAYGLREGCLFESFSETVQHEEPLLSSCRYLARRVNSLPENVEELSVWVLKLASETSLFHYFESSADDSRTRRLFQAACLLADIAIVDARDYQSRNAFERILTMPITGLSHEERLFLAMTLHTRYAGNLYGAHIKPFLRLVSPERRYQAIVLGRLLRFTQMLSARQCGIVPDLRLEVDREHLILSTTGTSAFLLGERVGKYLSHLASSVGRSAMIE